MIKRTPIVFISTVYYYTYTLRNTAETVTSRSSQRTPRPNVVRMVVGLRFGRAVRCTCTRTVVTLVQKESQQLDA